MTRRQLPPATTLETQRATQPEGVPDQVRAGPKVAAIPSIRLEAVAKRFGLVAAVNGVSLTLAKGQLLALLGPSGCGKTTLLRLIAGFEPLDGGTIEIGGVRVGGSGLHVPPERRRVGMVFQEYALFPHLSVGEYCLRPPPLRRRCQEARGRSNCNGRPCGPRAPPSP
jgi:ABC-type polar amino acid transport system ATPase subunit